MHRIGQTKHDLVLHGSDPRITNGDVLKGPRRHKGLLDLLHRIERRGFPLQMEAGPVGRQIQIEDPDGNPIELFEPAR